MTDDLAQLYLDFFPVLPPLALAYVWIRSSSLEKRKRVALCALLALVAAGFAPPPYCTIPPPAHTSERAIWQWEFWYCVQTATIWLLAAFFLYLTVSVFVCVRRSRGRRPWWAEAMNCHSDDLHTEASSDT